jgi:peptidoglycan hydrolase-like protein with peptidoglycan-binding domain
VKLRPALGTSTHIVTWIAPFGATVERGAPLYRLDGQPAILLYGNVPQHRTLRFDGGAVAPVWVELEQAITVVTAAELVLQLEVDRLADANSRAVDFSSRLADAQSATPATPEFAQLTTAVRTAEAKVSRVRALSAAQLSPSVEVSSAEAELAAARTALESATRALQRDLAAAELDASTARVDAAEAEIKLDSLRSARDALASQALDDADIAQLADNLSALGYTGVLADQVRDWQRADGLAVTGIVSPAQMVIADGPVHIASHDASVGESLSTASPSAGAILDYSPTRKLATVQLPVGDRALATVGQPVSITLPDDHIVEGEIAEIGSVVTDNSIKVTIEIANQQALGGLEVAAVDVAFVSVARKGVLSVPIAALLARPEGGFALQVVRDGVSALLAVKTGLFASGRVEISGDGIAEGLRVGVPG